MLKIAVIGTGIIGRSHLKAIKQSECCTLCAVCDSNEEAAVTLANEYGVPYFTNYKDIAETEAEAVIINLPHWLHCEVSEFFLNMGLHVLVEKPMANTTEECDRMLAAAKRNDRKLAIGHVQRFFQANRKVKEICQSKELGELCMFNEVRTINYFASDRPKWFLDKKLSGGGIVMNYGAHALDKLFYITESKPTVVSATVGNIKNDCSIEGHAQIHIEFENKVSANMTFSGYGDAGYEAVYYFTEGALKVKGGRLSINTGKGWEDVEPEKGEDPFLMQLNEFCKLIKDEPSEIVTGDYAGAVIETIERIYL